jgi:hypothetical protein
MVMWCIGLVLVLLKGGGWLQQLAGCHVQAPCPFPRWNAILSADSKSIRGFTLASLPSCIPGTLSCLFQLFIIFMD